MSNGPSGTFLSIGDGFPRTCNFITILYGLYMAFGNAGSTEFGLTGSQLGIILIVLGIHGIFTKPSKVGIIRKFLSYMGAAPGAYAVYDVGSQIIKA